MGWLLSRARPVLASLGLAVILAGCGVNDEPRLERHVRSAWSEVLNQYQRRSDLIPNLVETVEGSAKLEQDTLTEVTDARAKVTQMQFPADILENPEAFHQFEQNQAGLGGALGRLLEATERYPELKSNQNFLALRAQLEGTENRIVVARHDYVLAVQAYNAIFKTIPDKWIASLLYPDAKVKETFTISEQAE